MRTLFPDEFDFYPETWFLPEQTEKFQNDARIIQEKDRKRRRPLTTFIVKPSRLLNYSKKQLMIFCKI